MNTLTNNEKMMVLAGVRMYREMWLASLIIRAENKEMYKEVCDLYDKMERILYPLPQEIVGVAI